MASQRVWSAMTSATMSECALCCACAVVQVQSQLLTTSKLNVLGGHSLVCISLHCHGIKTSSIETLYALPAPRCCVC